MYMSNQPQTERAEHIQKLAGMIKNIKIAMLTTAEPDSTLRSRPMATQPEPFDGTLWFFTSAGSQKVDEVEQQHNVNLSYADPDKQRYVSVSGTATLVHERAKIDELWHSFYKAWFPKGKDDPDLTLLKVEVEAAEYWDAPSNKMVQLAGFVKALATGKPYDAGENKKLNL